MGVRRLHVPGHCELNAKGHISIQLYVEAFHEELLAKALFAPSVKATTCAGF